jgi:hypothetical protein
MKKGKNRSRFILLLVIFTTLLAGTGAVYANKAALINSYYRVLKSPREYYTYLEKYGLYELVSTLPKGGTSIKDTYAYDISSNITFQRDELDSTLDTVLGTNLSDLEKLLGIPLNKVGLDVLLAFENNMFNETIGINLNDTKLFTTELYLDSMTQRMLLRFPELSDAYLSQSLAEREDIMNMHELQQRLLHTDLPERILRRYIELYFRYLGTVTLQEKVSLSLDKTDIECNLLTVTFTQEEIRELYLALLETAESDADILSLLPLLNITQEQYLKSLNKSEQIISGQYPSENKGSVLQLKLYVDHKGRVLSREIITFGQSTLGYTFLTKEDYFEYELHLSHTSTDRELRINGINRKIEQDNQGSITFYVKNLIPSFKSDINLDITYEDVQRVIYEGQHYLEGDFTLSSKNLAGLQITSMLSYKDNLQLNTTAIRLGASPLVEINSTGKPLSDYHVIRPIDSGSRYDFSEYNKYLSGIDFEEYLTFLTDSLGINLEVLLDLLR